MEEAEGKKSITPYILFNKNQPQTILASSTNYNCHINFLPQTISNNIAYVFIYQTDFNSSKQQTYELPFKRAAFGKKIALVKCKV